MRFHNPTNETLRVAGLAIPPGRTGTVKDAALAAAIKRDVHGVLAVTQKLKRLPDIDTDEDKLDRATRFALEEAAHGMGDGMVTRDGRPTCAYLSEVLGRRVTARERDAALVRAKGDA